MPAFPGPKRLDYRRAAAPAQAPALSHLDTVNIFGNKEKKARTADAAGPSKFIWHHNPGRKAARPSKHQRSVRLTAQEGRNIERFLFLPRLVDAVGRVEVQRGLVALLGLIALCHPGLGPPQV